VHGDAPPDDSFQPVEPDLKDVYFTVMRGFSIHRPEPEPAVRDAPSWVDDSTPPPSQYFTRPPSPDSTPSALDEVAPSTDVAPPADAAETLPSRDSAPIASTDSAFRSPDDSSAPADPPNDATQSKEEDPWALFRRPGSSA
jgi:hypothetical protein